MYEHRKQDVLPLPAFLRRMARHGGVALAILVGSLGMGTLGYHGFEGLPWLDALLNAAMLLGGMGPVNQLHTPAGKLFASFYALYSGAVFLVAAGILFAPLFHRWAHRFHLDDEDPDEPQH
jgi:hypothetical protein